MDIQGIEPWTSRMRSVRATTVPNAHIIVATNKNMIRRQKSITMRFGLNGEHLRMMIPVGSI